MISWYGKERKLDQAEEIFAEANSPFSGRVIVNSMIDAYVRCGEVDDAYFLYMKASKGGHDLGPVAISLVVNALSSNGIFFIIFVSIIVDLTFSMRQLICL